MKPRIMLMFAILLLLFVATFMMSIGLGSVKLSPGQVWRAMINPSSPAEPQMLIIQKIRFPRVCGAFLCGAALGVAGLLLQVFFRNPIVDSFILGISSGASLMVGLVMLAGLVIGSGSINSFTVFSAAFGGSVLVMFLVMLIAGKIEGQVTLLIVGMMIGYLCSAVNSILVAFSRKEQISNFVFWSLGSFAGFRQEQIFLLTVIVIPFLSLAFFISKPLNGLLLGETYARSMGVNVKNCRLMIILISSILSGAVTAFAGPVSFIGMAVPHIARLLFRSSDNRYLIPASVIIGAIVAGLCDLAARVISPPVELPLTAMTSFFGAPIIIYLLLKGASPKCST